MRGGCAEKYREDLGNIRMPRGPIIKLTLLVGAFSAAFTLIFVQLFRFFGYLLVNVDALLFFSSFYAQRRFGSLVDLQTFAFGQGFGAFQHPSLLSPFWWLLDWTASVQLAYVATEFLVFVGVFVFAYFASASVLAAGLAAFLATSFFFYPALFADHFGTAAPQVVLQIGCAYLALAALGFGLRRRIWMLAGFALLIYVAMMDWMYLIFIVPLIGLCLLALVLTAGTGTEAKEQRGALAWLLTGSAVTIALVYASGLPEAYDSFTLMSVRAWSAGGLLPVYPRSLLIWGGVTHQRVAIIAAIAAVLSMVYLTWRRVPFLKFLCPGVLAFLLLLAIADIDSTGANIYWTLPALGYFERPLIPLYAVVIACALAELVRRSPLSPRLRAISRALGDVDVLRPVALGALLLLSAGAGLAVVFAWIVWTGKDLPGLVYRPPYYWERTVKFVEALPVPRQSDVLFAPYFLDVSGEQLINDCPHLHDPGVPLRSPRYCAYMLNLYFIRNFFEAHNLSDLQTHQMLMAAMHLSRSGPGSSGANGRPGEGDGLAALKPFGVRYVAVDSARENALAVRDIEGKMASILDLGPITADAMSARSVAFAGTYDQSAVIAARLNGRAVVHDEQVYRRIGPLVPASDFALEYRHGAVAVQARSAGESIILLPFQFSHCLHLSQSAGAGAELIRVDGGQAALHFVNHADVRIANALTYFGDSACRKRDFADVFRLGIWPLQSFDDLAQGRRVPLLMKFYLDARLRLRDRIMQESAGQPARASMN
jgi:hypothetical protein